MKTEFELNSNLPKGKLLNIPVFVIIVNSVFQENDQYFPQVHLHDCFYEYEYEY